MLTRDTGHGLQRATPARRRPGVPGAAATPFSHPAPHPSPARPRALNQPTSGARGSRLPATLGHITAGPAPTANSCLVSHKASTSQHIGGPTPSCTRAPVYQDLARPWLVAALFRPRPWLFLLSHCGPPWLPHHSIFECALQFSFMARLILQPYWTRDLWDHGMVGLQHGSTTGRKSSSSGSGLVLASSCRLWLAQAPPAIHMQGRAMHSSHDLHSHPLAGHHSSITPGTLNGPGLPAANTRSPDTAPPYQTAGLTPCRVAPPRSQRSPGRTARTGLAVSRSCPTEHGRLGALPHAACPCSNPTLATTQTRPTSL